MGKKHLLFTLYGHYILSDGGYFPSYRYNLVCVAHYFLPYRSSEFVVELVNNDSYYKILIISLPRVTYGSVG